MLDKWFLDDIRSGFKHANRFVVVDEQGKCGFLLGIIKKKYGDALFEAYSEPDELRVKYEIEKNYRDRAALIYTTIPLQRLSFLREYCETSGCIVISHLHRHIVQKVNEKMGFDLVGQPDEIIAIGKLSIGKKRDYWDRIKACGSQGAFTCDDILEFLNNPDKKFKELDIEGQRLFISFTSGFMPYSLGNTPPETMAVDIASAVFDHIIRKGDHPFLDQVYQRWIDSTRYEPSLKRYLAQYNLPHDLDIWAVPVNHPFKAIDMLWLNECISHIGDTDWIEKRLPLIRERSRQPVTRIIDIDFWGHVHTLLSYDPSGIDKIHNMGDAIKHYQDCFHKVDNALRHLYAKFLAERMVLKPIQEYYQQILARYLAKWFSYFTAHYQEGQRGLLKQIISDNEPPVAIIVGDAISFEVSQEIVGGLTAGYSLKNDVVCADYPSETANNMGRLFSSSDGILETREKREMALREEVKKPVVFFDLDGLSLTHTRKDYTIFYAPDVDELSGKQNQGALKYYDRFVEEVERAIDTLFSCGYGKVYLVSDHGFVLTGILEESDKIEIMVEKGNKSERFCMSKERIKNLPDHVLEVHKYYRGYPYLYFSKNISPFKTKGEYGFSHGGVSPQELLIPFLCIEKSVIDANQLAISIDNKSELESVIGDIYRIKIKAGPDPNNMFSTKRKIMIVSVKDKREFNQSDIIHIKPEEEVVRECTFGKFDEFDVVVVDAVSKKRLDACRIKREIARDLGGLGGKG